MNKLKKIGNWAEKNKFWSDTIRSVVLGILGAYLVATIIESLKNKIAYKAETDKARLSLKVEVIREFSEKSYKYTSLAVRFREGKISFDTLRDAYDGYREIEHQMNVVLKDTSASKRAQHIADEMSCLLNKKDSLINSPCNFECVRADIKKESDSLEILALDKL